MSKKRKFRRVIAFLLCLSLIQSLFTSFTATPLHAAPDVAVNGMPAASTQPVELLKHRSEFSKRYLNPNGTFTEYVSLQPLHFKDKKNKQWLDIDSNLQSLGNGKVKNKSNAFQVEFPELANAGTITYTEDDATFSARPLFVSNAKGAVKDNKIVYKNVAKSTDLSYAVTPNGYKEELILRNANAPTTFTFEMQVQNLVYDLQEDNSIVFHKPNSKEQLFTIPAPVLLDKHLKDGSDSVDVVIRKDTDGRTLMDLKVDPNWLSSPNVTFPVILDPTVQKTTEITDTTIMSKTPSDLAYNWPNTYVGYGVDRGITRALYKFNLPGLPSSAAITSATVTVQNSDTYDVVNQYPVVEAHRISQAWDSHTVNWTNGQNLQSSQIEGTYRVSNFTVPFNWNVPITPLVQDWYGGLQPNYGLELKYSAADESAQTVIRELWATEAQLNVPYLTINYTIDGIGEQTFWTFDGPVNMANRNLMLASTDVSFTGLGTALDIQRTYNSRSTANGVFGYGWSSPLDMRLYLPANGPATFVDGSGTPHHFMRNANGTYESPPGMNWTLNVAGSNPTITTRENSVYTFTWDGKPTEFKDIIGNKITYSYNTSGQLSSISDAGGHTITVTYFAGSNKVYTLKKPSGDLWYYGFNTAGDLFKVTAPDSSAENYRYDSDHNLIEATSAEGKSTFYAYDADDRLAAINTINAVSNSNFQVDSNGDAMPDHWSFYQGYGGQSLVPDSGSPFGQAEQIKSASNNSANYSVLRSDPIQIDTKQTHTLSGYVKTQEDAGTQTTVLSLLVYDKNDGYLGEIAKNVSTGNSTWTRVSQTVTAADFPVNTYFVRVKLGANSVATAGSPANGSGISSFDAVQLEESNSPSEYASGNLYTTGTPYAARYDGNGAKHRYKYNEFQNLETYETDPNLLDLTDTYTWNQTNNVQTHQNPKGAVWKYAHNATTGNLDTTTDPNNNVRTMYYDSKNYLRTMMGPRKDTYLMTYGPNGLQKTRLDPFYTASAQDHDQYGHVSMRANDQAWNDNLVMNGNFEGTVQTNGLPQHFNSYHGQDNVWSVSTDSYFGNKSLALSASSSNPTPYTLVVDDGTPVDKSADYVVAGYLKATETSGSQLTVLSALAFDANNTEIKELGRMSLAHGTTDWQRWNILIRSFDIPSTTTTIKLKLGTSNGTGNGVSYFDGVQLFKAPLDPQYNLLDNGSFERGSATFPSHWLTTGIPTAWVNADPGYPSTDNVFAGNKSISMSNSTYETGLENDMYIPYDKNRTYTLAAFVKTVGLSSNVAHIRFGLYDANKTYLGPAAKSNTVGGDTDWKLLTSVLTANSVNSNTAYIRALVMTGNASGTAYFDNVRLVLGKITTEYGYDPKYGSSWLTSETDQGYLTTYYDYDSSGNVNQIKNRLGNTTKKLYNSFDQMTSFTPPGGDLVVNYEYDKDGNMTKIKNNNPDGSLISETVLTYNGSRQWSSLTLPSKKNPTTYHYDPSGNISSIERGTIISSYEYNSADQMTGLKFHDSSPVYPTPSTLSQYNYSYTYDPLGYIKSISDDTQKRTWTIGRDPADNVTSWTDGTGSVAYTPDEEGNVKKKVLTLPNGITKTESYEYNAANQPAVMYNVDGQQHRFLFTESNQLAMSQLGNGVTTRVERDNKNRITRMSTQTADGTMLARSTMTYDAENHIKSVTDLNGITKNYSISVKDELLTEDLPSGGTATYTYDPLGNRKTRAEKASDGTTTTTTYLYDIDNHLTQVNSTPWTYDAYGHVTSNGTNTYDWDPAGRLWRVTLKDGTVITYDYDAFDRRVRQTIGNTVTNYLYDGLSNHVLAEYDGNGAMQMYYGWSPTNQLHTITKADGTTYYTVTNQHGDVVKLTDAGGKAVVEYVYDAWGNFTITPTSDQTLALLNPYRYAGYRYDDKSGLYYLSKRYYDPKVGRMMSEDPNSVEPDYRYALNNPIAYVDPQGTQAEVVIGIGLELGPVGWVGLGVLAVGAGIYYALEDDTSSGSNVNDVGTTGAGTLDYNFPLPATAGSSGDVIQDNPTVNDNTDVQAPKSTTKAKPKYNRKNYGNFKQSVKNKVKARDKFKCQYCDEPKGPLEVDHVESAKNHWVREGFRKSKQELNKWFNDAKNLKTSCRACNRSKGSKNYPDEWQGRKP